MNLTAFENQQNNKQIENILHLCNAQERETLQGFLSFCGGCLAPEKLKDYMHHLLEKTTLKKSTVAVYIFRLKSIFKRILDRDVDIEYSKRLQIENFLKSIKPPKRNRIDVKDKALSNKQIKQLFVVLPKRLYLLCRFLLATGCRISETLDIKKHDTEEQKTEDIVKIGVLGKGKKYRTVLISFCFYKEILDTFCEDSQYLFCTQTGNRYSRIDICKMLRNFCKKIGMKNISPHAFRHTFATQKIVQEKKDMKAVSSYLGHSSVAITLDMYVSSSLSKEDLVEDEYYRKES